ncbi:MAG: NAD(P)-dependent oxidoreductase [Cytophagales bacterium]|nr:NAD(P)-dependent oxidoreductase [Cytophagales bacterium]
MNVLITGGAGYIGAALALALQKISEISKITLFDNLANNQYTVFATCKFTDKVTFIHGDILNNYLLQKTVKQHDIVVHLASAAEDIFKDGHHTEQVNHWGTTQLCDALAMYNKKLIYLSWDSTLQDEVSIYQDINASSYFRAEFQIKRLREYLIIHCGEVYGYSPTFNISSHINCWMAQAITKNKIEIPGNGRHTINIISLQNVVMALSHAIINYKQGDYNVAGSHLQMLDILEHMQNTFASLEFVFINPHLQLPSKQELKHTYEVIFPSHSLKVDLADYRQKLCFY